MKVGDERSFDRPIGVARETVSRPCGCAYPELNGEPLALGKPVPVERLTQNSHPCQETRVRGAAARDGPELVADVLDVLVEHDGDVKAQRDAVAEPRLELESSAEPVVDESHRLTSHLSRQGIQVQAHVKLEPKATMARRAAALNTDEGVGVEGRAEPRNIHPTLSRRARGGEPEEGYCDSHDQGSPGTVHRSTRSEVR